MPWRAEIGMNTKKDTQKKPFFRFRVSLGTKLKQKDREVEKQFRKEDFTIIILASGHRREFHGIKNGTLRVVLRDWEALNMQIWGGMGEFTAFGVELRGALVGRSVGIDMQFLD